MPKKRSCDRKRDIGAHKKDADVAKKMARYQKKDNIDAENQNTESRCHKKDLDTQKKIEKSRCQKKDISIPTKRVTQYAQALEKTWDQKRHSGALVRRRAKL